MSDDQGYADFLDKANQDTGASKDESKKDSKFASTKSVDTDVPKSLQSLDVTYVSDSDEPFEPVALKHNGKALDKGSFGKLIDHDGEVEDCGVKGFDPRGKYKQVIDAVKEAGDGKQDVKVFRVGHGETRAEYYVVTLDGEGNVVGCKAKAVES